MGYVTMVGEGRDLTPFERDFLAALEERQVRASVSSPETLGGLPPKLVVDLGKLGTFWVKDYSASGDGLSRIQDAQGSLLAEANRAVELVEKLYSLLLARLEKETRAAAAKIGLRVEMKFAPLG